MDRSCSETTVEDLPTECMARVLSFLECRSDKDAAALTCWRWRSLDALSRRSLHFTCGETLSEDEWPCLHLHLLHALRIFPCILSLSVKSIKLPDPFFSLFETQAFAHLQSLDLSNNSQINDDFMRCLAHGCRRLEALYVVRCNITDTGIDFLLAMCPNMQDMCVSKNPDIQGWGFRHGKRLTSITAHFCHITEAGLAEGLQGPTCLKALNINYVFGRPNLACIAESCKWLEQLHMSGSIPDSHTLKIIAQGCPNLKQLDASCCHRVSLSGWQVLALSSLKLEYLDVIGCMQFCDQSLLAIHNGCPNLRLIRLSDRFLPPHPAVKIFQASHPTLHVEFSDQHKWGIVSYLT